MPDKTPAALTDEHLRVVSDAGHPDCHPEGQIRDMAAELLTARAGAREMGRHLVHLNRIALDATGMHDAIDETGDGDWGAVWENVAELGATNDQLRKRLDRVTDLFEKWAAEESEHRAAGEYGIAEGFRVAIEELREAVHGTFEPIGGAR